jgi:hypothetical protein
MEIMAENILKPLPTAMYLPLPEGNITKHYKWDDLRCRGYRNDPCRAIPPPKAIYNLEIIFYHLLEPYTKYLYSLMIRKKPYVAQSYLCPKCSELRRLPYWNEHVKGREVDVVFTGKRRVDSWVLYEIAIKWAAKEELEFEIGMNGSCLELGLPFGVGL